MLYVAAHSHAAEQCPLSTSEGKVMFKQLLSDENVRRAGVKLMGAYVSCPMAAGAEHKGYFIMDANNEATVRKLFGTMTVDVRQVSPYSEVAKTM